MVLVLGAECTSIEQDQLANFNYHNFLVFFLFSPSPDANSHSKCHFVTNSHSNSHFILNWNQNLNWHWDPENWSED